MGLVKKIQNLDPVQAAYVQTAAAGTAPSAFIFVNPSTSGEYYEILGAAGQWDVVGSTSAAADVVVVPASTAIASGTSALASAFDLTAGARTSTVKGQTASVNARLVPPGSAVAVKTSGTLTGLTGLVVQVYLRPIRGKSRFA